MAYFHLDHEAILGAINAKLLSLKLELTRRPQRCEVLHCGLERFMQLLNLMLSQISPLLFFNLTDDVVEVMCVRLHLGFIVLVQLTRLKPSASQVLNI